MGKSDISVVIPVGTNPAYLEYLPECLTSIVEQNPGGEVVIVDDMANLPYNLRKAYLSKGRLGSWQQIKNDWLLGCSSSWNIGVSRASNEWCLLMGSDDYLLPGCLDACREIISNDPDPLGYYNLTCETSSGEIVTLHNNAALVSRELWRHSGGFPVSGSLGAPDAMLISIMMVHMSAHLWQIKEGIPLYFVREHEQQDTRRMAGAFNWEVIQVRNIETQRWIKPDWTKYVK